jgi:RAB protein geranylgeranyltransferase component A
VYVLKRSVSKLLLENGKVIGIHTDGKDVKCSFLVSNPDHLSNLVTTSSKSLSRAIIVTDKSLGDADDGNFIGTVPPIVLGNNKPITILQSDDALATCPDGTYLVHLTTETTTGDAKKDFDQLLEILFAKAEEENASKPRNIWSCLYNQRAREPLEALKQITNLVIPAETDFSLTFDSAFRRAEEIFTTFYPNEEFIPLVPNPEDIVFEPENADAGASSKKEDDEGAEGDG